MKGESVERVYEARNLGVLMDCKLTFEVSGEGEENAPSLRVLARSSVYNVRERKAIYCEGMNLKDDIDWYNPLDKIVKERSTKNSRIFVERVRNQTPEKKVISLMIQSAQLEDSGNWTCKSGELSETIVILVGEKVIFPDHNDMVVEADEGKTVRLDCVAKGSPTPVVQWYKDKVPIKGDEHKFMRTERGDNYQLEIRNLDHMDAGEYTCLVKQELLSHYTAKQVHLHVHHKPLLIDAEKEEDNGYITKYKTQEIYAIINETKNISCNTKSYPPPSFVWHKRKDSFDTKIPEFDTIFTNGTSSTFVLKMYNESNLGEYVCTAKNDKGTVSIVYDVTLGNRPEPPVHVEWINGSDTELWFDITCNCTLMEPDSMADNPKDLKVIGYNFQFSPKLEGFAYPDWEQAIELSVDIVNPNETIFVVGPLPNNTEWYTRVRSRNAAGFSIWVDLTQYPKTTNFALHVALPSLLFIISCIWLIL